jgi:hypothetical protein
MQHGKECGAIAHPLDADLKRRERRLEVLGGGRTRDV